MGTLKKERLYSLCEENKSLEERAFRAQIHPQVFLEVKKDKEVKYIECRYDKREHIEKLVMEAEKVVNLKDIKILISCLC